MEFAPIIDVTLSSPLPKNNFSANLEDFANFVLREFKGVPKIPYFNILQPIASYNALKGIFGTPSLVKDRPSPNRPPGNSSS